MPTVSSALHRTQPSFSEDDMALIVDRLTKHSASIAYRDMIIRCALDVLTVGDARIAVFCFMAQCSPVGVHKKIYSSKEIIFLLRVLTVSMSNM
jgi:hypothetical protein